MSSGQAVPRVVGYSAAFFDLGSEPTEVGRNNAAIIGGYAALAVLIVPKYGEHSVSTKPRPDCNKQCLSLLSLDTNCVIFGMSRSGQGDASTKRRQKSLPFM